LFQGIDMLMTEQEAKTKWCPMARVDVGGEGVAAVNRREVRTKQAGDTWAGLNSNCIGSGCMVWCNGHASGKGYCGLAGI
jgi:hypothetical protein